MAPSYRVVYGSTHGIRQQSGLRKKKGSGVIFSRRRRKWKRKAQESDSRPLFPSEKKKKSCVSFCPPFALFACSPGQGEALPNPSA
jgi:hypothetical protein